MDSTSELLYEKLTSNIYDWQFDEFTATHRPTNIVLWISNGFWSFKVYRQPKIHLGIWMMYSLWNYLKIARQKQLIDSGN